MRVATAAASSSRAERSASHGPRTSASSLEHCRRYVALRAKPGRGGGEGRTRGGWAPGKGAGSGGRGRLHAGMHAHTAAPRAHTPWVPAPPRPTQARPQPNPHGARTHTDTPLPTRVVEERVQRRGRHPRRRQRVEVPRHPGPPVGDRVRVRRARVAAGRAQQRAIEVEVRRHAHRELVRRLQPLVAGALGVVDGRVAEALEVRRLGDGAAGAVREVLGDGQDAGLAGGRAWSLGGRLARRGPRRGGPGGGPSWAPGVGWSRTGGWAGGPIGPATWMQRSRSARGCRVRAGGAKCTSPQTASHLVQLCHEQIHKQRHLAAHADAHQGQGEGKRGAVGDLAGGGQGFRGRGAASGLGWARGSTAVWERPGPGRRLSC
jgi:hypothetical protein